MRLRTISVAVLVAFLIAIPMVQADFDWSAPYNNLSSGYRVTTDRHGEEVMLGDPVTAWAGTTNLDIEEVKFRWMSPDGSEIIVQVTSFTMGEWEGQPVKEFSNTQWPDVVGDWGVQGVFYTDPPSGQGVGPIPGQPLKTEIRARSFYAVPDVATIAAVLAMFGALGLFALRKKRTSITTPL